MLWSIGLTLTSSERSEIIALAAHERRSCAGMIRQLTREALDARRQHKETA